MFLCKETIILFVKYVIIWPIIIFFIIKFFKEKEKLKKGELIVKLVLFLSIISIIPIEKIIDALPFKNNNIEKAFKFQNNSMFNRVQDKIIFKKKYKNTYFIVARKSNNYFSDMSLETFSCYYKYKDNWKPILQKSNYYATHNDSDTSGYAVYYCSNKKDKITGIFVTADADTAKLKDNLEIKDNYGTKFNYITNNNQPIKYFNRVNYIYFGIVDYDIDKGYSMKIKDSSGKMKTETIKIK